MTKKRSTKSALLSSILALFLCVTMLIGTTFAWFTDSVTSANNIITSGKLDVKLYYQVEGQDDWTEVNENTNVFNEKALWEPGYTEVVKLKVVNAGTLALKYQLGVNVADETGSTNVFGEYFELSQYIKYGIVEGIPTYNGRDEAIAAVDSVATVLKTAYNSGTTKLLPLNDTNTDNEDIVTMVVYMPTDVGNEANYANGAAVPTIELGINLFATQVESEEDSFDSDYDEGANHPKFKVTTANDLQNALNEATAGDVIKLEKPIELTEPIVIPAAPATYSMRSTPAPVVIDLNGNTLNTALVAGSTTNHAYAFENHGNLVITGNGTINARGIFNYGNLVLENGTINAIDGNGGYAVRNYAGATFTMNGGTIATTLEDDHKVDKGGYDATTVRVDEGATFAMNGGVINNICDFTFAIDNLGTTIVNAGTVTSVHSTVSSYGTLTINGGSFTCNGLEGVTAHALVAWENSETNIYGGTFDGKDNYNGFNVDAEEGAVVNIYGGNFLPVHSGSLYGKGTINVYGGTFADNITNSGRIAVGYKVVETTDGTWAVSVAIADGADLQKAIENAKDGEVITLVKDITFTEGINNNGISCVGTANFTLDLNGHTVSSNLGNNALRFKIGDGNDVNNTNVTINIKNGNVISDANNWCAISASAIKGNKLTLNLEDLVVEASKAGDYAIKSWDGAIVNAKNVKTITKYAGGFYAVGGEMVLDNCEAIQTGLHTEPYMSMAFGVSGNGKMTVNSGNYFAEPAAASDAYNQGTSHGSWVGGVMNSGGTLIINGGTFTNGNFGDDSLATAARGLIFADTASVVKINGGTFNAVKNIIDYQNNLGKEPNPDIVISGGTFSSDPMKVTSYGGVTLAEGYETVENNGVWTVEKIKVAEIDGVKYATLQEAINAADGKTVILLRDIVVTETVIVPRGITVTLDLNGMDLSHKNTENSYVINNLGTLTLKDSKPAVTRAINARGIYNGYDPENGNVSTAKLIIESGTYNAMGTNGGAAVFNYGIAHIKGGNFTSVGGYSLNNQSGAYMIVEEGVTANNGIYCSNATLVVNGGKIEGNRSGCHVVYAWNANVTINGGEIHNNNSGNSTLMAAGTTTMTVNGGTFSINDGRVPGNNNTWTSCLTDTQNTATLTVNGGTFNGGFRVQAGTSMTINGGSFNDVYGSNYNIYGTVNVKGGTYTDATAKTFAGKYVAENYVLGADGVVVAK